jgi:oligoribonuclease NrnB/cAMP/cGMP phosphodiesterase (DHH superfamily)
MKTVLITHDDLDGAGCAILMKIVIPDIVIFHENYSTINMRIKSVLMDDNITDLFIADICPDGEHMRMLNEFQGNINIKLLDHHKTTMEYAEQYDWVIYGEHVCGTVLIYNMLRYKYSTKITNYAELVEIINGYDLWIHDDPRSMRFNTLFQAFGMERFVERCIDYSTRPHKLLGSEIAVISVFDCQERRYANHAIDMGEISEGPCGATLIVMADRCQSLIGELVRQRKIDVDYVTIMDLHNRRVSLRSVKDDFDVTVVAKIFGGGGHAKAAGYEISYESLANFIESWI